MSSNNSFALSMLSNVVDAALKASSAEQACIEAVCALDTHAASIPFALFYLLDGATATFRPVAFTDLSSVNMSHPSTLGNTEPLVNLATQAMHSSKSVLIEQLDKYIGSADRAVQPARRPNMALLTPFSDPHKHALSGFMVTGMVESDLTKDTSNVADVLARLLGVVVHSHLSCADSLERARVTKANADAAQRAKDDVFAMLGHELRNPLAPIVTALQLMRARGEACPEQEIIERQVAHMLRLVNDLLDVSRLTKGKIQLKKRKIELYDVVTRAVEMVSPLLEQQRHKLNLDIAEQGYLIDVDPDRFAQVIANLLSNAAKYSPRESAIHIFADKTDNRIAIHIKDSGLGISPDMLERIFDLFVQQPQTLERASGGLGLGLTIVRNFVELHGGSVTAHSQGLGKGSEFVVDVMVSPASTDADAEKQSFTRHERTLHVNPGLDAKRILVVDDNEDAAAMLAEALKALYGYHVDVAHDGLLALKKVTTFKPDVALLDIGLPVMNGYELARLLRQSPDVPKHMRIIAITGYGQQADKQRSENAGFDGHMVKPVDLETLNQSIETFFSQVD